MVTSIEPPAIVYCAAPNPSNGLTRSAAMIAFNFSSATPIATSAAERIRGKSFLRGVSSDMCGPDILVWLTSRRPDRNVWPTLRYVRVGRRDSRAASRARLPHAWDRTVVRARSVELARVLGGAGVRLRAGAPLFSHRHDRHLRRAAFVLDLRTASRSGHSSQTAHRSADDRRRAVDGAPVSAGIRGTGETCRAGADPGRDDADAATRGPHC